MNMRIYAAGLCAAVMAVTAIAVAPVDAATKKKQQVYTTAPDRPVTHPRARITVAPRSFLDAGTEVLPGERKLRLPCGLVFDAFERGAKHGWARRLAPVAAAGAVRSSEPL